MLDLQHLITVGWKGTSDDNFFEIYGTDFTTETLPLTNTFTLKPQIMSRQNRNQVRERKTEETKRDVSNSNQRYSRQQREEDRNDQQRMDQPDMSGLDRYRLNDLYERSSLWCRGRSKKYTDLTEEAGKRNGEEATSAARQAESERC